jgi:hypothetical protein
MSRTGRLPAAVAVPFLKRPHDPASLPVLTDELIPARSRNGRTLWLAWDERRVPLLEDVVVEGEPREPQR